MTKREQLLAKLRRDEEELKILLGIHNSRKELFSLSDKELEEYNDDALDMLNELRRQIKTIEESENQ